MKKLALVCLVLSLVPALQAARIFSAADLTAENTFTYTFGADVPDVVMNWYTWFGDDSSNVIAEIGGADSWLYTGSNDPAVTVMKFDFPAGMEASAVSAMQRTQSLGFHPNLLREYSIDQGANWITLSDGPNVHNAESYIPAGGPLGAKLNFASPVSSFWFRQTLGTDEGGEEEFFWGTASHPLGAEIIFDAAPEPVTLVLLGLGSLGLLRRRRA